MIIFLPYKQLTNDGPYVRRLLHPTLRIDHYIFRDMTISNIQWAIDHQSIWRNKALLDFDIDHLIDRSVLYNTAEEAMSVLDKALIDAGYIVLNSKDETNKYKLLM